jgi:hypothetical protein
MALWHLLQTSLTVTAFVAVMMLAIEYLNVQTSGVVTRLWSGSRVSQYLLAVVLGATPGCLGAFAVVSLYLHRQVSIGSVVAAMVVTSGDEMFVMLSMFPQTALLMTAGLALPALAAGWAVDLLDRRSPEPGRECSFDLHWQDTRDAEVGRRPTARRVALAAALFLFLLAATLGLVGPREWDWMRCTLVGLSGLGLFVVVTVSDHFLDEHLWRHVVVKHVPRVFLWTWGALTAVALLRQHMDLERVVDANPWAVLGVAALVGVIPESGPHLVFVAMFAEGAAPLGVLLASSAVQDGHGMLPLLGHSRRDFLVVKLANLVAGLLVGGLVMCLGL